MTDTQNPRPAHRDRYKSIAYHGHEGEFLVRIDDPADLTYLRERPQYDKGRDNGYVYTTPEHTDDECEKYRPGLGVKEVKIR